MGAVAEKYSTFEDAEKEEIGHRVDGVVAELKKQGYNFEIEDLGDEYVVSTAGVKKRVPKTDSVGVKPKEGAPEEMFPIEKVVKAVITNPGGSIYLGIKSENFENDE